MKYISIQDGQVSEIVLAEDPALPGFALEQRFSPEFIATLVPVKDDVRVEPTWSYDAKKKKFAEPPTAT